jgi:hypothetical protein
MKSTYRVSPGTVVIDKKCQFRGHFDSLTAFMVHPASGPRTLIDFGEPA